VKSIRKLPFGFSTSFGFFSPKVGPATSIFRRRLIKPGDVLAEAT
jgi:hypothetical protein